MLIAGFLFFACAPQRKNPLSNVYHNTTAHYNSYFIAKEKIKEIEASLDDGYQWNYNKILPVYAEFDSTDTASYKTELNDIIAKAAISIQRHPGSDWEDDSYILVGKARFYGLEFADAVETYKYVNTHSKNNDERHTALVNLMRTFVKNNELKNASAVSDFLKKEKLNKKNLRSLYLNRAYLHQQKEDLDLLVGNLVKAEELITKNKVKARINFIIGQIYQELGFDANAYDFYNNVLKNNPAYELDFYTRLNIAQVTNLTNGSDTRKVRRYFEKLLADQKNLEYQDKIYYEIGNFELKQGNLDPAIDAYKASAKNSVNNKRQQGLSFWELGKIYFDSLANYETAKSYYDSTIAVLPKDEEAYKLILERQVILADFVKNINIIKENDSLLYLASLDSSDLIVYLDDIIAQKKIEVEIRKKKERKAKRAIANNVLPSQGNGLIDLGNESDNAWYFSNTAAVSRGRSEFKRNWGERKLEDNWRRSKKQLNTETSELTSQNESSTNPETNNVEEENENTSEIPTIESLIATIPFDTAIQNQMQGAIETAHYELGKIYHFQLKDDPKAVVTFEELMKRYSNSIYEPEVLYLLFLINNGEASIVYKNRLINDHPETIYAKLAVNPNYREESNAITAKLQKIYKEAYALYEIESFQKAAALVNNALREYPNNEFTDNMALLRILIIGKTDDIYKYQFELGSFVKSYAESDLKPYVESLIKASEEYQINLINSAKAKFSKNFNKPHQYVIVYENKDDAVSKLPAFIDEKLAKLSIKGLNHSNLILDDQFALVLIIGLADKPSAIEFSKNFQQAGKIENEFKALKVYEFIITDDNFNVFYKTKELETYLKFFRNNY